MKWVAANKASPVGAALADRHYNRRKVGSPQFMPPGQTLVLVTACGRAVWGWWRPDPKSGIKSMNGLDGWTCTIFRNEGAGLSSELILEAEVVLRDSGHGCGPDGMLTYVDPRKIASSNPGACFIAAGWKKRGLSKDRHKVLLGKVFELAGVPRRRPSEVGLRELERQVLDVMRRYSEKWHSFANDQRLQQAARQLHTMGLAERRHADREPHTLGRTPFEYRITEGS